MRQVLFVLDLVDAVLLLCPPDEGFFLPHVLALSFSGQMLTSFLHMRGAENTKAFFLS